MKPFLLSFVSCLAFGHGLHSLPHQPHTRSEVSVKDLGGVVAVRRSFPVDFKLCEKSFDEDVDACNITFTSDRISHLDYAFPIPLVSLSNHAVSIQANEYGYSVHYFGDATSKLEKLTQIRKAFDKLAASGITSVTIQLYRSSNAAPPSFPVAETVLGTVVGVKRSISIRLKDCEKTLEGNACWVKIVDEAAPDHPGPSGGGDQIGKEYAFSEQELVSIRLENLYGDYVISYEGPEQEKSQILKKIGEAIEHLKGSEKQLTLVCSMFTIKKHFPLRNSLYNDSEVSDAVYFEVAMPLEYKLCEKTLNTATQNCRAVFSIPMPTSLDHTGGTEHKEVLVVGEGQLQIYGSYVAGNPFWDLHYDVFSTASLSAKEMLKRGFDLLHTQGQNTIRSYGFRSY